MLTSYLKIALRSLRRERFYAVLNVAGLAVGIACCALILLHVRQETSYDRFHEHAGRIVRIAEDRVSEAGVSHLATTPAPLAPILREEMPELERVVRLYPAGQLVSASPERRFQESGFLYADPAFFEVFSFPFVAGDPATALADPMSVVLTRSAAQRHFGGTDPIGRPLTVRNEEEAFDFTVTGVVEDVPPNSHFGFDLVAAFSSLETTLPWYDNWWYPQMYTYALLREGADPAALEAALPEIVAARPHSHRYAAAAPAFTLQPVTDIHLRSHREAELGPNSHAAYVTLFVSIALGILGIACVNFMNLATARATRRAREVGVRKALGAMRRQLAGQFLAESLVRAALAAVLAVGLVALVLPAFNDLTGKTLRLALGGEELAALLALVLATGLVAGGYPALVLSRFRPERVLRGSGPSGRASGVRLRKGLTAFQFALSIALVAGSLAISRQLELLREERLGFDKEHVVVVPLREQSDAQNHAALEAAWEQLPGVQHVAASSGVPGMEGGFATFEVFPERAALDSLEMMVLAVDYDYAEALGLELVAGRDFDEAYATDASSAFVINEAAARTLGWSDPVGERLTLDYHLGAPVAKPGEVVGVVRDFQYHALREAPRPLLLHLLPGTYYNDFVSVRLAPGDLREALAALEAAWATFNPERPFEYTFLDEQFDALYRAEAQLGTLTAGFTLLAVLIACLGLLGLAAYAAERRRKEIGIRKALGASVQRVVRLLVADFLEPVVVAAVLAIPLAYLILDRWLEGFAERVTLDPDLFIIAAGLGLSVALLTVSVHAFRIAMSDPVKALRYE